MPYKDSGQSLVELLCETNLGHNPFQVEAGTHLGKHFWLDTALVILPMCFLVKSLPFRSSKAGTLGLPHCGPWGSQFQRVFPHPPLMLPGEALHRPQRPGCASWVQRNGSRGRNVLAFRTRYRLIWCRSQPRGKTLVLYRHAGSTQREKQKRLAAITAASSKHTHVIDVFA